MKTVKDTQKSKGVSPKRELSVKLVPLSDKDDIKAYLVTFERVMTAQKSDIGCWSQHLAPQLTGWHLQRFLQRSWANTRP